MVIFHCYVSSPEGTNTLQSLPAVFFAFARMTRRCWLSCRRAAPRRRMREEPSSVTAVETTWDNTLKSKAEQKNTKLTIHFSGYPILSGFFCFVTSWDVLMIFECGRLTAWGLINKSSLIVVFGTVSSPHSYTSVAHHPLVMTNIAMV